MPKKGIGETTLNKIYSYGEKNKLCLEDSILKLIEKNEFKPKIKNTFQQLINLIQKWRLNSKEMKVTKKQFRDTIAKMEK